MSYDNDITLAATTETTIVAAPGAGTYRHLRYLMASTTETNAKVITVRDGTAGTVRAILGIKAGASHVTVDLRPPKPLAAAAANTNWTVQNSHAGTTYIFAQAETSNSSAPRSDSIP